jgi:hypothetical protein
MGRSESAIWATHHPRHFCDTPLVKEARRPLEDLGLHRFEVAAHCASPGRSSELADGRAPGIRSAAAVAGRGRGRASGASPEMAGAESPGGGTRGPGVTAPLACAPLKGDVASVRATALGRLSLLAIRLLRKVGLG